MIVGLLALIALELTVVIAMFAFELGFAGKRYRGEVEFLLGARVDAELERVLRDRINGSRHVVRAGQQRHREGEQNGEQPDFLHALKVRDRKDVPA